MIDQSLHSLVANMGQLGQPFQIAIGLLVIQAVLIFIALPTAFAVISMVRYLRQPAGQHHALGWALQLDTWIGRFVAWLVLLLVFAQVAVILLRHVFDVGSLPLQESIGYLHASIILLGAAYTLAQGQHVRLDVWYRRLSRRFAQRIDLIGHLLLLIPACLTLLWVSSAYIASSWRVSEASASIGGLPFVFVVKSLIGVFALMLLHTGIRESLHLWNHRHDTVDH